VVQRKSPAPAPRRPPTGSVSRIFALAGIPALLLLAYVLFWTLNMRGAYYRDQLQAQIKALRVERMDLEAEKRRRQSPGQNLARAKAELGMVPAREREFARVSPPASGRLASR